MTSILSGKLKDDRIQSQYYLKNLQFTDEAKVKEFVLVVKEKANSIADEEIKEIREKLANMQKKKVSKAQISKV